MNTIDKIKRSNQKKLIKFCKAEKYACELYSRRSEFFPYSKTKIYSLVKKKFRTNPYVLEAVEAGAESWNYHSESGNWYESLKKKIPFFSFKDLSDVRKVVKLGIV